MYKKFKQFIYRRLVPFIKLYKRIAWRIYLAGHDEIKLIVGGGTSSFKGWFATDISTLNVTKESDFRKYFSEKKIGRILAEHVLEHLTNEELDRMLENFRKYSSGTVNIRVAVPDGYHSDSSYIEAVKPGGTGEGAHDHKNLFNYKSLADLFARHGFRAEPLEYWDEGKIFHTIYKNDDRGYISRSFLNDERNKNGKPNYTSLIIDFNRE